LKELKPVPEPSPMALRVESKEAVADEVVLLTLVAADGAELPAWEPGAHVDLLLGADLVRQYSLCGDPDDRHRYRVAVLREPAGRGGSAHVHDTLAPGTLAEVTPPRNHFRFEVAPRYLFIAGGVGITPIRPMLRAADRLGADWQLVYGGRTRSSMAFVDELVEEYGDRVVVRPHDEHGLLDLRLLIGLGRPDTQVYCCGPEPLIAAVEELSAAHDPALLHVERFVPRPIDESLVEQPFEVELRRTGVTAMVAPGRSIIDVAEENGAFVLYSCTEGTCGTCQTTVLEGVPEHRDSVLTPQERSAGDTMMICVGRSAGDRLVLDL
jgi:ferredoxin-NADP reductase